MKFILLIIFTIIIYSIGSYLELNTQTDSIGEKRNFRVENAKTSVDEQKSSESENYKKIGYIGQAEQKNNASATLAESSFSSETDQEQNSIFELIFFLCTLVFTVFLVILHFYGCNQKARKYKRFDRNLLKQKQLTDRCLSTQGCDL